MNHENCRYAALQLCAVLIGVYALQVLTSFNPAFQAGGTEWWTFFTSFLGHSDAEHLLNNLFFIGMFGTVLELRSSSRFFLKVFFSSAIFANLTAFFFYSSPIIGASGGAMGVLAALAVYRPNQTGLALGIPLPMWAVLIIYILIQFAGLTGKSNTAYLAHLFGLVAGSVYGVRMRDRRFLESVDDEREDVEWRQKIRDWEEKYMM